VSTGPQKYPGASTSHWYQDQYGSDAMETNVVVWHSTETANRPGYANGSEAPNLTAVPDFTHRKLVWHQHFDIDRSSRALENLTGGVETNTLNVVQVEIVGTCDPTTHGKWGSTKHLYMPELPDWVVQDLADFSRWVHDNHGVPLTSGVVFKPYPSSYGAPNGVRMPFTTWNSFRGHCGHQHVPENLHGDPGAFPMTEILTAAARGASPHPPITGRGAVKSRVSLSKLIAAAQADPKADPGEPPSHPADVAPVNAALLKLGHLTGAHADDGTYGTSTVAAYAKWQSAYSAANGLGWAGSAVNGIPGETSLKALATRSGVFTVVA
jgi:hypothetical protein